jgi:hypothetical protein
MRGPPVSCRFPCRALLSARRRRVTATRPHRSRTDAAVYPVRAPVSMPRRHVLAPLGRANPLHRRPRRLLLCHPTPPSTSMSSCRAAVHAPVRPRHAFPGRLPSAGEVAAAVQACRATARTCRAAAHRAVKRARAHAARTLTPAELGQVVGRTRCAGRLRRHCATGPSADSAQWHLIIFLYFLNIFNSLQIQKFV